MKNREREDKATVAEAPDGRMPYRKPEIKRVDLALEETMSTGCKLAEVCDAPPFPASDAGS